MLTLPNLLSLFRLALAPILLFLASASRPRLFFAGLVLSLITDALDGFLARRLNQSSELGVRLDSWADLATAVALPFCAWWLRPAVLRQEAAWLTAGILFYFAAVVLGFLKFGRLTSYHTWGAKVAAILVGMVVLVLFAGGPGWPFRIVMPVLILAEIEEIAITTVLREYRANVPSLWHALQIKRQ